MKKLVLPVIIASVVLLVMSSCKKTVKAIFPGAETPLPELQYTLDSIYAIAFPVDTTLVLPLVEQPFFLDSIVKVNTGNNFGAGDITSVKIKQLDLKLISGAYPTNNLSNFDNVSFKFSSSSNSNAIKVASVYFSSSDYTSKVIPGDGTPELRGYLDGNKLYYEISLKIKKKLEHKMKFSIIATMVMK